MGSRKVLSGFWANSEGVLEEFWVGSRKVLRGFWKSSEWVPGKFSGTGDQGVGKEEGEPERDASRCRDPASLWGRRQRPGRAS